MYKVREIQSSDYIDCFNNQHIAHGLHQRGLWTQDIWGFVARWFRPSYVTEIEGQVIAHNVGCYRPITLEESEEFAGQVSWNIMDNCVHPAHRKNGVSDMMMELVGKKEKLMSAYTDVNNEPAYHILTTNGFVHVNTIENQNFYINNNVTIK
tara:strand:+ start:514 stop:969 length:456 start_codon:yes stop_codon:yes gene_type:complete